MHTQCHQNLDSKTVTTECESAADCKIMPDGRTAKPLLTRNAWPRMALPSILPKAHLGKGA